MTRSGRDEASESAALESGLGVWGDSLRRSPAAAAKRAAKPSVTAAPVYRLIVSMVDFSAFDQAIANLLLLEARVRAARRYVWPLLFLTVSTGLVPLTPPFWLGMDFVPFSPSPMLLSSTVSPLDSVERSTP